MRSMEDLTEMGGRTPRRRRALAVAVAAALLLAGCAGGSGQPAEEAAGTVRISLSSGIDTVDPLAAVREAEIWVHHLVGGTLFAYVPGDDEVVPGLAESIERSDDGLTVTVELRADGGFSDGSPVTAADVAATFQRAKETPLVADDDVFGSIVSVEADGDRTAVFTLSTPRDDLETQLAQPRAAILPAAVGTGELDVADAPQAGPFAFTGDPITSGPFTLERNDHYAGPAPSLQSIEFHPIGDISAAVLRLQAGDIDVLPSVLPAQLEELSADYATSNTVTSDVQMMTFNTQVAPFDDPRVRAAIGHALDRERLATIGYAGLAEPVLGPYPAGLADVDIDTYDAAPDLDRARELLQGTACEAGCSIEVLSFASTPNAANIASGIAEDLQPLGFTVQNQPVEDATFVERNMSGSFQATVVNFTGPTFSGFVSSTLNPEGGLSAAFTFWDSPEAVELAPTASQGKGDERIAAQEELAAVWAEDAPWLPLVNVPLLTASTEEFADVVLFNSAGLIDIATQ